MMMVNNETGALYDLKRVFAMVKSKNSDIVTHTDAVQGFLKCRFTPKNLGADLVTVSAHKIHGPKGVGALYVSADSRRRRDIVPWLIGGGQEAGFRSGTENLIGIAGFGEAVREGYAQLSEDIQSLRELRDYAIEKLGALSVRLNLPKGDCAPHVLNLTLPDIRSETMLHSLSKDGIFISNGSACSSHHSNPSSALLSFGLTESEAESSIRVSFSKYNTKEDVDALAVALESAISRLVSASKR
jgi:cysteine desulfurase